MTNKSQVINKQFKYPDGSYISYRQIKGSSPGIFYMHGSQSSIDSTKALFVENYCKENGIGFTSFNFTGHGDSSGKYTDGTISIWLRDALAVMDNLTSGDQIVIGSSLGGWIMLLLAMRRPDRVKGMIGLAAAPDFTVWLWEALPQDMRDKLLQDGIIYTPSEYSEEGEPWTLELIQDGNNNLVLNHPITTDAKVILFQGDKDDCVPVDVPLKIKDRLTSKEVRVIILKGGKHNLSEPHELLYLQNAIKEIVL